MDILAKNIKILRQSRGLSQDQLANLSGIHRASISALERDDSNPSLRSVMQVAEALGVSLEELLSSTVGTGVQYFPQQSLPRENQRQGQVQKVNLLPKPIPGLQFEQLHFRHQVSLQGTPHLRGTWEYCTCVKGELIIIVEGEEFHLKQGDVLSFPGHKRHSYRNPKNGEATAISVIVLESRS